MVRLQVIFTAPAAVTASVLLEPELPLPASHAAWLAALGSSDSRLDVFPPSSHLRAANKRRVSCGQRP